MSDDWTRLQESCATQGCTPKREHDPLTGQVTVVHKGHRIVATFVAPDVELKSRWPEHRFEEK